MARFAITGNIAAVAATYKSMVGCIASANKRPKIYDVMWGADGTPADNALVYALQEQDATTAGTATSVTPKPLDAADPASDTTANEDYSVEPTADNGIPMIELPINLRASYRWVAAPGSELVIAATVNLKTLSQVKAASYTGSAKTSLFFEE